MRSAPEDETSWVRNGAGETGPILEGFDEIQRGIHQSEWFSEVSDGIYLRLPIAASPS